MNLTFLGTGSAIPSERMQSGILLEDDKVLFDCGSGVLHNLNRTDVPPDEVGNVFLTHNHLDHVNDLLALVKADWLLGRESLKVYGPTGTHEVLESLFDAYDYLAGRVDLEVYEVEPGDSFSAVGREFDTYPTEHSVTSMAYRVDDAFVYTGDTEAVEGMADFASGCDTLIHECAFPDSVDVSNHTRPSELAPVLEECDVNKVYITHLYPHTRDKEGEMLSTLRKAFEGKVWMAQDMKSINVEEGVEPDEEDESEG